MRIDKELYMRESPINCILVCWIIFFAVSFQVYRVVSVFAINKITLNLVILERLKTEILTQKHTV